MVSAFVRHIYELPLSSAPEKSFSCANKEEKEQEIVKGDMFNAML